jgi:DNA polymerase III subunit beta
VRFHCEQEQLTAALKAVLPAVPSRPLVVTDAGILLSGADGHLEVAATNREIAIQCRVGAHVAQPGEVVLPARTITDLVALMDVERVDVALDEKNVLELRCMRTQAHVRGWDIDEFPVLPEPAGEPVVRVEANALRDGIGRVIYAASPDPTRMSLCGTLMQFAGEQVTLVAADGFRLALCAVPLVAPVVEPFDLVVPTQGMRTLQKLLQKNGDENEVSIALSEGRRRVIFEAGDVVVGCQLGGKYPDYHAIIPQKWDVRAVADRSALLGACRTARALSEGSLRIEFVPPGQIVVSSTSVEAGEGKTELEAAVEGACPATVESVEGAEIGVMLNVRYLADAVTAVAGKQVAITASVLNEGQYLPVLVRPVGVEGQLGLVMPMQSR